MACVALELFLIVTTFTVCLRFVLNTFVIMHRMTIGTREVRIVLCCRRESVRIYRSTINVSQHGYLRRRFGRIVRLMTSETYLFVHRGFFELACPIRVRKGNLSMSFL